MKRTICVRFIMVFLFSVFTMNANSIDFVTTKSNVNFKSDKIELKNYEQTTQTHPLVSKEQWNTLFPYRFGAKDTGGGVWVLDPKDDFYTYESFIEAINRMDKIKVVFDRRCGTNAYKITRIDKVTGATSIIRTDVDFDAPRNADKEIITEEVDYGAFLNEGDLETRKRELMAFFANISHETTGGWDTAPGGRFSWGLHFREEPTNASYAYPDTNYPPTPGKSYKGRGPIQLSYNYNYGPASEFIFGDKQVLLDNPDLVIQDAALAFQTAIWFWMTPQYPKPSAHNVMVRKWTPNELDKTKNRVPGLGMTVNIINGGVECGQGTEKPQVLDRIGYYERFASIYNIGTDMDGVNDLSDCGCKDMAKYGGDSSDLTAEPCAQKPAITFVTPINDQLIKQTTFSAVGVSISVDQKNSVLKTLTTTIGTKTFSGTTFSWTPEAYGAVNLVANATFENGLTASNTIKVVIWDGVNIDCTHIPAWRSTKIYDKPNNYVTYNNAVYRNKWYAGIGTTPGVDGVWEKIKDCGVVIGTPPVVSWQAPTQGQVFETLVLSPITLTANATDNDGTVTSFSYAYNGTTIAATKSGNTYSGEFTPTAFGAYTLEAVAEDNDGKVTRKEVSFTVKQKTISNEAPVVTWQTPTDNLVIEQDVLGAVALKATATDSDGIVSSFSFKEGANVITATKTGNNYTASFNPASFGEYALTGEATDDKNAITTKTIRIIVKEKSTTNPAPVIANVQPQNGSIIEQTALTAIQLKASITDNSAVQNVAFSIDNTAVTANSTATGLYTATWTPSAFGNYSFKIVATDDEGASSNKTVSFTIKKKVSGGACDGIPAWEAKIYAASGTKVTYNGVIYKNKWYASSTDVPGASGVWEYIQPCGGTKLYCGSPEWIATKVYNTGDKVYYSKKIYRAKWWTRGSTPNNSNEWAYVQDCLESSTSTLKANIYPTIVSDEINVTISTSLKAKVKIELRDTSGNLLQTLLNTNVEQGTKVFTRDLSGLKKGVYIYSIHSNGNIETKKIIKN
ncbi:Por secretion system C-terminal sorting domain-containing protein [Tenacibaculum sp. MAR_2009_124]|uniref:glycoside hydrolase family 19 protein n=1 Tax=Tenacibaculum sp. MAR_2009_124 TaxID=1250059 RepID=UPI0008968448|nr:glycoside hydrolase family 19 protein [Tenacibaculum sp. MAR_2009_124]SEB35606.1 Por secretion system C-terminal sorting domain-containing protein [Tenacibaculum sp. MAR_2009_124]